MLITQSIVPAASAVSFAFTNPMLGVQMNSALSIMNAATSEEIERLLPEAQQFADHYRFYLPVPKHEALSIDLFQRNVCPWFAYNLQDKFSAGLQELQKTESPFQSFQKQGLLDVNLPDVTRAGLITFGAAQNTLSKVEDDIIGLMESSPSTPSKKSTIATKVLRSPILHGLIAGALLIVLGVNPFTAAAAGIVTAIVEHWIIKEFGIGATPKDDFKYTKEELSEALHKVSAQRERLDESDHLSTRKIALPAPKTTELMIAEFLERAKQEGKDISDLIDKVGLIEKASDLNNFANENATYVIVQTPNDGSTQIRVARGEVEHSSLLLEDDNVLAKGNFLCRIRDPERTYRLMIDMDMVDRNELIREAADISTRPVTSESSIEDVIRQTFEDKVKSGVDIRIGGGGWDSGFWV